MDLQHLQHIDKQLVAARFAKAAATYNNEAHVQREIANKMLKMLQSQIVGVTPVNSVLEIGCGTGIYSRLLINTFNPHRMLLNDICPPMKNKLGDILNDKICFAAGDAENARFSPGWQLITSCSALQWLTNLAVFFRKCHDLLESGGYLAFSIFGPKNLTEIAELTGQHLEYLSVKQIKAALTSDYNIIATHEELLRQTFTTPAQVLYHLKHTGVTGISRQTWTKTKLQRFYENYAEQYTTLGGVTLTYHPIYIIAAKKQQR